MPNTNWKRKFMTSEHEKRKLLLDWKRKEKEMLTKMSYLNETAEMLFSQVRKSRHEVRSQMRAISHMKTVLEANNLHVYPVVMSVRICPAEDNENCPLAMDAINTSTLPFVGCCPVMDPLKPTHKCAQLACGHRFNAVWVMYHFVRNSTFRCPVCRKGKKFFSFDSAVVPECMVKAAAQSVGARRA